jgi:hypothetical protein
MRHALELNPGMINVHNQIAYCLLLLGRLDEAANELDQETGPLTKPTGQAIVAHRQGRAAQAQAAFAELVNANGDNGLYQQGEVLAQWGDTRGALAKLARARAARDAGLQLARADPLLDPIRGEPEFSRLLQGLGFD